MNAHKLIESLNALHRLFVFVSQRKARSTAPRKRSGLFQFADAHTLQDIGLNMHKAAYSVTRRNTFE